MRATYKFVSDTFDLYNKLCFNNKLPRLPLKIGNAQSMLGSFTSPRRKGLFSRRNPQECVLRISARYELDEDTLVDTIIHEMIHYYIWFNNLSDTGPHGPRFKAEMMRINRDFNRHISVRHKRSETELMSDNRVSYIFICITEWTNGKQLVTSCARSRIYDINKAFCNESRVVAVKWYLSRDVWFKRLPVSRTPKAYLVNLAELQHHLRDAVECICTDTFFLPKPSQQH